MKFAVISFFLCVLTLSVTSEEPECTIGNCQNATNVGCFIGEDECRCFCVTDKAPCHYLIQNFQPECASDELLQCSTEVSTCKCRCVPDSEAFTTPFLVSADLQ
ncbi:uncharacterized protein LOC119459516 [Dermacentor silvarum]|uniref:uncharacterized protein LOC119459516 n=1 Tax=Dermacentor silvarum TaxID=543639 RepID=UPI0021014451|nr:uncharacterized protein LOC119459516 [Dermacentor silvarum]